MVPQSNDASGWRSDRLCKVRIYMPMTNVSPVGNVAQRSLQSDALDAFRQWDLTPRRDYLLWRTLSLWSDILDEDRWQGPGTLIAHVQQGKNETTNESPCGF
jgi:hypothetical protein